MSDVQLDAPADYGADAAAAAAATDQAVGDGTADVAALGVVSGATASPTRTKRPHRARKPILIAVAVVVALLAAAGGTLAAFTKTVTVTVDGASKQVTTLASDVEGALSAAGVAVGPHDTLAPAGGTSIGDGSQIVVQRGRLFSATIDGKKVSLWTTATTVDQAMAALGRNAGDFKLSADRSREIPLSGLTLTAQTLHAVIAGEPWWRRRAVTPADDGWRAACRAGHQADRQGSGVPAAQTRLKDGTVVTSSRCPR